MACLSPREDLLRSASGFNNKGANRLNSLKVGSPKAMLRPLIETNISGADGRKFMLQVILAERLEEHPGLALMRATLVATGIVGESAADDHRT